MTNIVLYCAHADDVILGAGGYVARLAADEGNTVTAVFATDGLLHAPKFIDTREWAKEACRILGVTDVRWLNLANQRFDTFAVIDVNQRYESLDLKPDLMLTNSRSQLNKDHRIIYESARVVTRPLGRHVNVLSFESTPWRLGSFQPQLYVDITDTLNLKTKSMKAFKSEVRPWPHPRSMKAIKTIAAYWGMHAGYEYAEPYEVVQWFR